MNKTTLGVKTPAALTLENRLRESLVCGVDVWEEGEDWHIVVQPPGTPVVAHSVIPAAVAADHTLLVKTALKAIMAALDATATPN